MIGHWNLGGLHLYGRLEWVLDVARRLWRDSDHAPEHRPFVQVWR